MALMEKTRQRLGIGSKSFTPTSITRCTSLLHELRAVAHDVHGVEAAVKGFDAGIYDLLQATGRLLVSAPIVGEYAAQGGQLGKLGRDARTPFSYLYKGRVRRHIQQETPALVSLKLRHDMLMPLRLWLQAFEAAEENYRSVEKQRLKLDAQRRKAEVRLNASEKLERKAQQQETRALSVRDHDVGSHRATSQWGSEADPMSPTSASAYAGPTGGSSSSAMAGPTGGSAAYSTHSMGGGPMQVAVPAGSPTYHSAGVGASSFGRSSVSSLDADDTSSDSDDTQGDTRAAKLEHQAAKAWAKSQKPYQKALVMIGDFEEAEGKLYERLACLVYDGARLKAYLADTMLYLENAMRGRVAHPELLRNFPTRVADMRAQSGGLVLVGFPGANARRTLNLAQQGGSTSQGQEAGEGHGHQVIQEGPLPLLYPPRQARPGGSRSPSPSPAGSPRAFYGGAYDASTVTGGSVRSSASERVPPATSPRGLLMAAAPGHEGFGRSEEFGGGSSGWERSGRQQMYPVAEGHQGELDPSNPFMMPSAQSVEQQPHTQAPQHTQVPRLAEHEREASLADLPDVHSRDLQGGHGQHAHIGEAPRRICHETPSGRGVMMDAPHDHAAAQDALRSVHRDQRLEQGEAAKGQQYILEPREGGEGADAETHPGAGRMVAVPLGLDQDFRQTMPMDAQDAMLQQHGEELRRSAVEKAEQWHEAAGHVAPGAPGPGAGAEQGGAASGPDEGEQDRKEEKPGLLRTAARRLGLVDA